VKILEACFHFPPGKKPSERSFGRLSLVAGVVLLGFKPCECHFGVLYYQIPLLALLVTSFLFPVAYKCKLLTRQEIKNPAKFFAGFLVVDKVIEISNLELISDLQDLSDL
jgi:hypothetical protein